MRSLTLDLLDDAQAAYFSSSIVDLRLNLAMWELQKRLISANKEYFAICSKTNTVVGQQYYSLPSDFMQVVRLEWYESGTSATSLSQKIEPMTPNQRDLLVNVTGSPQYYTFAKAGTGTSNARVLCIWPIPDRIVEVHLEYNYQVSFMTADADVPDIPAEYHEYIHILATRDCLLKDGRPIAPIESKLQEYETLMKQIAVQRQADSSRMVVQTAQDWSW